MIGVRITNCRGESFCVSTCFFPPSSPLQASHANTQWGQIMQFQSHFCVEHFLAALSDIDLQAICFQFTPRGQLNRQLLEKALLDGELKVHPALPLSDLHLSDYSAASNTAYKANKKAVTQPTEQRSLITVRADIKTTLRQILDQERFDAQQLEKQYQQKSSYEKSLTHIKQFAKGLHSSGISFLTWLKDVHDVINMNQRLLRIIKAAMAADDQNHGQRYQVFKQTLAESEKKELVEALGFDPSNISVDQLKHVYALANLIYEDLPTRIMLTQFVKDYADAQHSLEWSEFSGGAAFEVILTALLAIATGGVGAIASLGAQARKISQLKKLGNLMTELAEGLKNLPKEKSVSLRKLKEIEDRKEQHRQKPTAKQAPEPDPATEKERADSAVVSDNGRMRGKEVKNKSVQKDAERRAYLNAKYGRSGDLNSDINIRANRDKATNFYLDQGWHPKRVESHVSGIDFSQPVDIVTLSRGQPLAQYQAGGNGVGNYFAPVGTRAEQLGINPSGRETLIYAPIERVQVLRSTAAEIVDTWSVPGVPYRAEGGGTQFFTGNPDKFRVIIDNE